MGMAHKAASKADLKARVAALESELALAAGDARREADARLRAVLDAMPDCVKIFDAAGALVHINPKGLALLEAPDLAALSRPGYEPVPAEFIPRVIEVHRRVMEGESVA